jgi:hypothetical protein
MEGHDILYLGQGPLLDPAVRIEPLRHVDRALRAYRPSRATETPSPWLNGQTSAAPPCSTEEE